MTTDPLITGWGHTPFGKLDAVDLEQLIRDAALREFVARHRQQQMLSLVGEGLIDPSYDVRQVRAAMSQTPFLAPSTPDPRG